MSANICFEMILSYYKGNNFGDALNPLVFNHHFPDFFNHDESSMFLGIGSILGFIKPSEKAKKIIVFTSGFAYDSIPKPDQRYDIRCVRGPMTAEVLKINPKLAVTDGALLLRNIAQLAEEPSKKYKYCYVPHHISESMFDRWKPLFRETGIEFVSPAQDPLTVIRKIRESEFVLAEAMHAAIVADTFRVPWIPVKMFGHINNFKWQDWFHSMELGEYKPVFLPRLYSKEWIEWIFFDKLGVKQTNPANKFLSTVYRGFQTHLKEYTYRKRLKIFADVDARLSSHKIMNQRLEKLLIIAGKTYSDYHKPI